MKVILTQELKGRGGEGDVIEVARGFAVNYLLPRKFAIEATPGNLKQLEQRMHNIKKREDARVSDAGSLAASLADKVVTVEAKVGDEGRLFGSITSPMIHAAILEQLGVDVDRRRIETHGHIKQAGPHTVDITIYRDVKAQLTVDVVPEGGVSVAPVAEAVVEEPVEIVAEAEEVAAEAVETVEDEAVADEAEAVAEESAE